MRDLPQILSALSFMRNPALTNDNVNGLQTFLSSHEIHLTLQRERKKTIPIYLRFSTLFDVFVRILSAMISTFGAGEQKLTC